MREEDHTDKPRAGLLADFGLALLEVATVSTLGADKYTPHGWKDVPDGEARYTDAMWRHLLANEDCDQESGLLHEAHVAWNALARLELRFRGEREAKANNSRVRSERAQQHDGGK